MRVSKVFRASVCSGVALSALLSGGAAFAQDETPTDVPVETLGGQQVLEEAAAEEEAPANQIVVTGTLVRGIAPPGANVIGVNEEAIQSSGATTVAQVLQTIPQLGSFGTLQQPLAASGEVSVNRPNLRSLPGFNTSGGSSTLVMMDGHRLVGMGVSSTSPDPDIIPPGVLERVEIVPDGGSALYGSDAVAGVMNFITIKRFDGVKVDGSYGFADDYYQYDANATVGKDWGSGSIFASYTYAKTDEILGKDRDYVREFPQNINNNGLGYTTLACGAGAVQDLLPFPNGRPLPGTGIIAGLPDVRAVNGVRPAPDQSCDASDFATVYPSSRRHSVFGGLTQDLDDTLSVDIRAYYTNRKTHVQNGPFRLQQIIGTPGTIGGSGDVTAVTSSFSNASTIVNAPFGAGQFIQRVYYPIGDNDASQSDIELDTWGVSPTFTKDLDGNFRVRVIGTYGQSTASLVSTDINEKGLQSAIRGGLINPYNLNDPTTTFSGAVLDAVTNWETFAKTRQRMLNGRAIVDGELFSLPGGGVKLAAGLEYSHETFIAQSGETIPGFENSGAPIVSINGRPIIYNGPGNFGLPGNNTLSATAAINPANISGIAPLPRFDLSRNVKSAFGEVVIPIFGADNEMPGFERLTISVSGRYDDYSDFGDTFNPRIGMTWKPINWISLHGAFGESFNAPSLADDERASLDTLFILSGGAASFFTDAAAANGGYPPLRAGANNIVALRGNKPDIQPQEAKTYSAGFDIDVPFADGLRLSATYYKIDFKNFIGLAAFENPPVLFRDFGPLITTYNDLPAAEFQALLDSAFGQADVVNNGATSPPSAATTYAFFDARKQNIGDTKVSGIDLAANYRRDTGFGAVFFNANGTYVLDSKLRIVGQTGYRETITANQSRFKMRSTLGADIGSLTAQVTWNHLQGYDLDPATGFAGTSLCCGTFTSQTEVGDFNFFDLFFKYDVPGEGWAEDLSFTLNVNNVFDQDPPEFRGSRSINGQLGYANGATLGRLVQFGVSKRF